MPTAACDGIATRYEVLGTGPPLLMLSPGGFNATIENWRTFGIYRRLEFLEHLPAHYSCVVFDKRESGHSGGRVEAITWESYAAQALGLLDHLGIERAHVMGGCVGCSIAIALAATRPQRVASLVLYSPAGGPRYRVTQHARFAEHRDFVDGVGLGAVVELARSSDKTFAQDPRVGPWASVLRTDAHFADAYARVDAGHYLELVEHMARTLFDRDTVAGAEADQLMKLDVAAFVVPGQDANHAPSAARYLEECLEAEYWDVPVGEQTEETAPARVLAFLAGASRD